MKEGESVTFIVILVVGAILLERYTAVWSVPSFVATTFPLRLAGDTTLAVVRASGDTDREREGD